MNTELENLKLAQSYLELLINATPSGSRRNKLTEENIQLLLRIKSYEAKLPDIDSLKIKQQILREGLTITKVIDVVIELNGYIGVGLITLGDQLQQYVHDKIKKS